MSTIHAVVRDRRINVPAPLEIPDGTEVRLHIETQYLSDDNPMSSEEIVRIHAAMLKLQPLELPQSIANDLDAWEQKLNQRGIDQDEAGFEDVLP